jgi:hypothetical protein
MGSMWHMDCTSLPARLAHAVQSLGILVSTKVIVLDDLKVATPYTYVGATTYLLARARAAFIVACPTPEIYIVRSEHTRILLFPSKV